MIIDLILDRNEGVPYRPHKFYTEVRAYGFPGFGITGAMDEGEEEDVKQALKDYLDDFNYPQKLKEYIDSVNWL